MMKHNILREEFIDPEHRPMLMGKLPITPSDADVPVLPADRWRSIDGKLVKQYRFRNVELRNNFVAGVMAYEAEIQHYSELYVTNEQVAVRIYTHDVDRITELDKEFAVFCDVLYRDVVYNPYRGFSKDQSQL